MKWALLTRERSEEEKIRRHLYGDKGATFASRVPKIDFSGCAGTVTTFVTKEILLIGQDMAKRYMIRKLTARECFRFMGVKDSDVDKIQAAGLSESRQYKMAGNSIVVPVLEGIFTQMFRKDGDCLF